MLLKVFVFLFIVRIVLPVVILLLVGEWLHRNTSSRFALA